MSKEPEVPVTIRFPKVLHVRLTRSAASTTPATSFNREVVARLYNSFEHRAMFDSVKALSELLGVYDSGNRDLRAENTKLRKQLAALGHPVPARHSRNVRTNWRKK